MKKIKTLLLGLTVATASFAQDGLPSDPKAGKCYVKCITPNEFKEITETYIVEPEYKILKVIPSTYKTVEERVMVKEASKKLVVVPAVYETVSVDYVSKQSEKVLSVSPATFGSDSKTYESYPATSGWEYTLDPNCKSANPGDCIVACFKEYPAKSSSYTLKTVTKSPSVFDSERPELKSTFNKQVIKTAARVDEIEIPAEYATIKKSVIDVPARTEETVIPAITKTITKTVLAKKGGMTVWEELDCNLLESNVLPILYPLNSAELTAEAKRLIDENLLQLMTSKPLVKVEIMSHTDSRGSDEFNLTLSQQRAQSVVNYLVTKGIDRSRLTARGYGETRLKNNCSNGVQCSEEQHHQNRRTEFRVVNQ